MKRHFLPFLLSLLLIPIVAVSTRAQATADAIIEKHLAAMGGREALGKLTTRKATGTITIVTANGTLTGPVELYSKLPNKTRAYMVLDLSAMGMSENMTLDQKFDGALGWTLNSLQGDNPITGNQLENMKNATFPNPLLNYKAAGTIVEALPNETIGGKDCVVLRMTPKAGSVSKLYLDATTYLAVRTVAKVTLAGTGEFEQVAEASDYRTVDGVKIPFKTTNTSPIQTVTIVVAAVQHNLPIDDAMFGK